jgi:acetoin utilization deacetylase AcuC-like enzyme
MTTGWVWDERYMWHDTGSGGEYMPARGWIEPEPHSERPATKRRFRNLVEVSGLLRELTILEPTPASVEDLVRFHSRDYVERIKALSDDRGGDAGDLVPFGPGSYEIALLAVGGCTAALDAVLAGQVENAYALVRPPGHHAEPDLGRGYCIFANVPLAVMRAKATRGLGRVAILDWDVHHGNAAQKAFWTDPQVLTISVHQDQFFPLETGAVDEVGDGPGRGYNLNVPLPAGSGVPTFIQAYERVVVPALLAYRPEVIMVSSGLDASAIDPQSRMMMTSDGFRQITRLVMAAAGEVCDGRIVACHEGGYSSAYVPFCGLAVVEELARIRTAVEDPYLEFLSSVGGQASVLPHQKEAIAAAEENLKIAVKAPSAAPA